MSVECSILFQSHSYLCVDSFHSFAHPVAESSRVVPPPPSDRFSSVIPISQGRHLASSQGDTTVPRTLQDILTPASASPCKAGGRGARPWSGRITGHSKNLSIEMQKRCGKYNTQNISVIPKNVSGLNLPVKIQRLQLELKREIATTRKDINAHIYAYAKACLHACLHACASH